MQATQQKILDYIKDLEDSIIELLEIYKIVELKKAHKLVKRVKTKRKT